MEVSKGHFYKTRGTGNSSRESAVSGLNVRIQGAVLERWLELQKPGNKAEQLFVPSKGVKDMRYRYDGTVAKKKVCAAFLIYWGFCAVFQTRFFSEEKVTDNPLQRADFLAWKQTALVEVKRVTGCSDTEIQEVSMAKLDSCIRDHFPHYKSGWGVIAPPL